MSPSPFVATAAEIPRDPVSRRVAGSFRDPDGYVFLRGGRVYRAVTDEWHDLFSQLESSGLIPRLVRDGLLIESSAIDDSLRAELMREQVGFGRFVEHPRLWPISYPYEWTVSMLADAAIRTIDLQLQLIEAGCSLKDATAYNVQFQRARPRMIDVTSIQRPRRLDLWPALGQFSQMFTYPLLLASHCGWDLRSYFQANLGGLDVARVARSIGLAKRLRPDFWLDVTLPYLLSKHSRIRGTDANQMLARANTDSRPQVLNLKRLRAKIAGLGRRHLPASTWTNYTATCTYDEAASRRKRHLIRTFLTTQRPATVLDLGCNTGDYSRMAADCGCDVIAADQDAAVVDALYRQLREQPQSVTPMVVDLANPSPAIGFCNQERECFLERGRSECVFALALVHHLLVTGNLSVSAVRDMLAKLTTRLLVVEYVPADDPMVVDLCKRRVGPVDAITLERFLTVLGASFVMLEQHKLPNGRTLLMMRKRSD